MNNLKTIILIFTFFMCSTTNSNAYLDPGTGSIILQAIIGFIAASVTAISIYWSKFKSFISRLFGKKEKEEEKDKSNSND